MSNPCYQAIAEGRSAYILVEIPDEINQLKSQPLGLRNKFDEVTRSTKNFKVNTGTKNELDHIVVENPIQQGPTITTTTNISIAEVRERERERETNPTESYSSSESM